MKTRLPISTISYNTPDFLVLKLKELENGGILSFWCFICHHAECDEKKAHIHLYAIPSKTIQTDDLRKEFVQPVPGEKPLSVMLWNTTKDFSDWYLYGLHDEEYLASKGLVKEYHYRREEMIPSDSDILDTMVSEMVANQISAIKRMCYAIQQGMSFTEYLREGRVSLRDVGNAEKAWRYLSGQWSIEHVWDKIQRGEERAAIRQENSSPGYEPKFSEVEDDDITPFEERGNT